MGILKIINDTLSDFDAQARTRESKKQTKLLEQIAREQGTRADVPPQWFVGEDGIRRYWNGVRWTV